MADNPLLDPNFKVSAPKPRRGGKAMGVKRVNRVPLAIAGSIVALFCVMVAMTAAKRQAQQAQVTEEKATNVAGATGGAGAIIGENADVDYIPPADASTGPDLGNETPIEAGAVPALQPDRPPVPHEVGEGQVEAAPPPVPVVPVPATPPPPNYGPDSGAIERAKALRVQKLADAINAATGVTMAPPPANVVQAREAQESGAHSTEGQNADLEAIRAYQATMDAIKREGLLK